jgi:hypothetical protein
MDDKVPGILSAIELVDHAIALVQIAQLNAPSDDQTRSLQRNLLRLNTELAVLKAELDAALNDGANIQGPNAAQIAQIDGLINQVEQATDQNASIDGAISLTGQVLDLAIAVVSSH